MNLVRNRLVPSLLIAAVLSPALLFTSCGSSDNSAATITTTSVVPSSTVAPTTTTTSTTTTTIYAGPPTLAPGASLPVPAPLPPENQIEPEVVIGDLVIPALLLTQPIYVGMSLPTLDKGVGYWPGTAMPGHVGNVVLGGHRVSKKKPFRNIDRLIPGDEIYVTTTEGTFVYAVQRTEIVLPTDTWIIDQTDEATMTLFACHPPNSTRERIVVFADFLRKEVT